MSLLLRFILFYAFMITVDACIQGRMGHWNCFRNTGHTFHTQKGKHSMAQVLPLTSSPIFCPSLLQLLSVVVKGYPVKLLYSYQRNNLRPIAPGPQRNKNMYPELQIVLSGLASSSYNIVCWVRSTLPTCWISEHFVEVRFLSPKIDILLRMFSMRWCICRSFLAFYPVVVLDR